MRKLIVFNSVTVDGYFADKHGSMSWAHSDRQDAEWDAFVTGSASGSGTLLFGRITYDLMASYWPTPVALKNDPVLAERMNRMAKFVFSRTLDDASWNNTKLIRGDIAAELGRMKTEPGDGMTILGSGSIVAQLAPEGLIDEYQIVVNPVVLGAGTTMFEGLERKLDLKLAKTRQFGNGKVLLCYEPTA